MIQTNQVFTCMLATRRTHTPAKSFTLLGLPGQQPFVLELWSVLLLGGESKTLFETFPQYMIQIIKDKYSVIIH